MNTNNNRLQTLFANLRQHNKKALVPFITTGDPHGIATHEIMHALVKGGGNIIELGMPFSDPAADGETIQHASERAIANGVSYKQTFDAVRKFRESDNETAVVLMGYLNPAEIHPDGFVGFAKDVSACGADALILVDLSYESGESYRQTLAQHHIDLVTLVAPTTTDARLGSLVNHASGFIYYVSMRGITGSNQSLDTAEISQAISKIRENSDLPVCIGFGISDGETAKSLSAFADGVVVGSALVKKLYNAAQNNEDVLSLATDYMASLRHALDN